MTNNAPRIAIVGWSCRLPGANSVDELWRLLRTQNCSVSKIPADRWSQERLGHPRSGERGRSYTWAAGVLDDIWGFDPQAFGLSPREAEQMDPQQRLLLELTWEALEDAGIKPSDVSGSRTGVFIGASALDHGQIRTLDISACDAYFATGNTLSIVSNRISYVFNLHGPSLTIDTACSSALVALNEAVNALQSGRVDTAVVGGVNILASPFGFVGFSQASMLSRQGLCQAFSSKADGYVRAEGGVVLLLTREESALANNRSVRGLIVGSKVNSDGHTNGISLPSAAGQMDLLTELYGELGIDANQLAFIEAHGTGTPVGDPIEAYAVGRALGVQRAKPLLIGSIKTNIGHMEAASGLAGVMKACLALKHRVLPASLHCEELNPHIDFDALNLQVCTETTAFPESAQPQFAGVNSFGFGGTNAHVVLGEAPNVQVPSSETRASYLILSAHSRAALTVLINDYAASIADLTDQEVSDLLVATAHRREHLRERFVVAHDDPKQLLANLSTAMAGQADSNGNFAFATALDRGAKTAFVYSGNGGQWLGMGVTAYRTNPVFKAHLDRVDRLFREFSSWSLVELLHSPELTQKLELTSVAQPLIFALQAAATEALRAQGLCPSFVFGHSVGEVAAAEAAGLLDLADAVRVIYFRSLHQERVKGQGGMAVVIGAEEAVQKILDDLPGLEIAAHNNPRAFTLAGETASIRELAEVARRHKLRVRPLDLDYPFHSRLMEPIHAPLLEDLANLHQHPSKAGFISTVYGRELSDGLLDADYWWQNIRAPVLFNEAMRAAVESGARIFIEIGPDAVLQPHLNGLAEATGRPIAVLNVLDRREDGDPIRRAFAAALACGAEIDAATAFGADHHKDIALVSYPWQREHYRLPDSIESSSFLQPVVWHLLIGARLAKDQLDWHALIDTDLVPFLKDHQINGQTILPGAAFVEMALAVARDWLDEPCARIQNLEIVQPMFLKGDSSREVICRVEPQLGRVEISSRPRLGHTPWQLHAVAKIIKDTNCAVENPELPAHGEKSLMADQVYEVASAVGLQFGPAFRNLSFASRVSESLIRVDLRDNCEEASFSLDPGRLDSCFHGLILLFADFITKGQSAAFVPTRFGEVNLLKPACAIASARIDIRSVNERAIVADYVIFDADGGVIATLKRVRYQALPVVHANALANSLIVQNFVLATEPAAARLDAPLNVQHLRDQARAFIRQGADELPAAYLLMEGWATALGWEFFQAHSQQSKIDIAALVEAGQLPASLQPWAQAVLTTLSQSGLITQDRSSENPSWKLCNQSSLPSCETLFQTFAADHPDHSAELLLMAWTNAAVMALKGNRETVSLPPLPATAVESFEQGGVQPRAAADFLIKLLDASAQHWPKDRSLRILQIGHGPLSTRAALFSERKNAQLTILESDKRRIERARLFFTAREGIQFAETFDQLPQAGFDLVIATDSLHRLFADRTQWPLLRKAMSADALFCAVEPSPCLFRDMIFGLDEKWFHETKAGDATGAIAGPQNLSFNLGQAALTQVEVGQVAIGGGLGLLAMGQFAGEQSHLKGSGDISIIADEDLNSSAISSALATLLTAAGVHADILSPEDSLKIQSGFAAEFVFLNGGLLEPEHSSVKRLTETCLFLKQLSGHLASRKAKLWLVSLDQAKGNTGFGSEQAGSLGAVSRTLANEYPMLDIRRVNVSPDITPDAIADRLRRLILSTTHETDIFLDSRQTKVLRFERGHLPAHRQARADAALRLERGLGAGLDRMSWLPVERQAPQAEEVEIEIEATGLNFRDLMWSMGLLPEEILENGFAGAALGLECAGRVTRVGLRVTHLRPGDLVAAFAKHGFATHATIPAAMAFKRPEALTAEAAATIPVAFVTAYYSLISCARLKPNEWVVIHGGAGGVGLAALQIALWRRARVIATASSAEKRSLLKQLGAEHVFDSRSGGLFDEVRQAVPEGVHVVLNSLSGEAMERSIGLLRPFGRFIELGKRDYVADTSIGLRPFHRNLTYFGVDLDQLMEHDKTVARKLFRDVMALFSKGHLTPLPHRCFAAEEMIDALRLMQQSGHIGKLVVQPPQLVERSEEPAVPLKIAPEKTHLITGGLGGFGLETARWLVKQGAKHIILVGRQGAVTAESQAALNELAADGATVKVEKCDIADRDAVKGLFARLKKEARPLAGVFHEAMVLDDAIIQNLTADKIERVLRPKVLGAELLDRMTQNMTLDYFILFSSATTMIGNPGQAAYVMANGFMEGLARRRRKAGLAALAIAWGAIDDVGVLSDNDQVRDRLAKYAGIHGLKAREALDLMAAALRLLPASDDRAVIALAPMDWAHARKHLAIFNSPTYARLPQDDTAASGDAALIDIKNLLMQHTPAEVSKLVADEITEQIARVLRLPREDVARNKPLAEIGLDSLMGMELALALEQRFGLSGPLMSSASGLTVLEVADHVIAVVTDSVPEQDRLAKGVIERHLEADFDASTLGDMKERFYEKSEERKNILS